MKFIKKQAALSELQEWAKANPGISWKYFGNEKVAPGSLAIRRKLQETLLDEQGFICAYCNTTIHLGEEPFDVYQLRMDHLECRTNNPDKTYDYYNIVGSCYPEKGRIGFETRHCDVSKDYLEIPKEIFPTGESCETVLKFGKVTGIVTAKDPVVKEALNKILNLNCQKLKQARKEKFNNVVPDDSLKEEERQRLIKEHSQKDDKKMYKPYAGAIINFLKNYPVG